MFNFCSLHVLRIQKLAYYKTILIYGIFIIFRPTVFTQKFVNCSHCQFTKSVFTYLHMQDWAGPLIITSCMTWWQFSHWCCSLEALPFQNLLKEGRKTWIMMKLGKTKRNHCYQTQIKSKLVISNETTVVWSSKWHCIIFSLLNY